ncbi:MAG: stage 0 sporulation family protein [Eubacteriales bacterium]|nr:stage 0 sporulation family protein [Eubacteriales bacterium]
MPKVVAVRFREGGKAYHFDPGVLDVSIRDLVIVETSKGVEIGTVVEDVIDLPEEHLHAPLKSVLRLADEKDININTENKRLEKEAFPVCVEKIASRGLEMNLVDVEYSFDGSKIVFYFTAEGRIDFRELVRDLASVFRMRIELRQIGVRDEAKMIGGLGICGRELCCCSFLSEFMPVSIKMAKEQNLSMNPAKISGACGRLLCCLKYEQNAYEDAHCRVPRQGTVVQTNEGSGIVVSSNLLRETVQVRLDRPGETDLQTFRVADITFNKPCQKNQRS